jgi:hypothetical protein
MTDHGLARHADYDALAVSAFEGAPEELDVTLIPAGSPSSTAIEDGAARLVGVGLAGDI